MHRQYVNLKISRFHCDECGAVTPLPRPYNTKTREFQHTKHIWCYQCESEQPHTEERDGDYLSWHTKELMEKDVTTNGDPSLL